MVGRFIHSRSSFNRVKQGLKGKMKAQFKMTFGQEARRLEGGEALNLTLVHFSQSRVIAERWGTFVCLSTRL